MKALVGAFNQEKALVGAFSVIVQPVVEPIEHYTALIWSVQERCCPPGGWCPAGPAPAETSGCRQRTLTYTSPSHCPGTAATSGHSTTRRTPPSGCTLDTGPSSLTGKHLRKSNKKKFTNRCNRSFSVMQKFVDTFHQNVD